MQTEYDGKVLDFWKFSNGICIAKIKKDDGLDGDNDVKNTLLCRLGAFILSNTKQVTNFFIRENNGSYNKSIFYGDTNSMYVAKRLGCIGVSWFSWI